MMSKFIKALFITCAVSAVLVGCANKQQTIYGWYDYEAQLYTFLKNDSLDFTEQLQILKKAQERMEVEHLAIPPGFHAQIGLLYSKLDQPDLAIESFQSEKNLFPESAEFMNFVIANFETQKLNSQSQKDS